jgi:hypothetical protein
MESSSQFSISVLLLPLSAEAVNQTGWQSYAVAGSFGLALKALSCATSKPGVVAAGMHNVLALNSSTQ